ncbi:hypothetical protein QVD17_15744 [Tagetes erecta]|uniref:Uncharacterized protein n=1 Tax=Tagetes erecta TaxID=13708 RepID=A0AAD8KTR0_TARER|nr:hypothetical protein QVD17_15744 [Tagetes erecta]
MGNSRSPCRAGGALFSDTMPKVGVYQQRQQSTAPTSVRNRLWAAGAPGYVDVGVASHYHMSESGRWHVSRRCPESASAGDVCSRCCQPCPVLGAGFKHGMSGFSVELAACQAVSGVSIDEQ